jgi:hypothetical protein
MCCSPFWSRWAAVPPNGCPTAQATLTSARPAYTYAELAGGFTPAQLSNLIFANEPRWNALYLGLLPCLLALFGLLRRWRVGWLFGAVAVFALGLSLGGHGFVFSLIYRALGKLVIFRQQERAVVLVIFCICTLAALGLASILALRPFNLATQRARDWADWAAASGRCALAPGALSSTRPYFGRAPSGRLFLRPRRCFCTYGH